MKCKRAVSPVFSTVLLILIVVAGMAVVFAFLVAYVGDFQTGQGSAVLENFVIENVWFKNVDDIEVTIFNYGKIDINVTSMYIDGLLISFSFENENSFKIPAGEHRTAIITPISFNSNTAYQFKIVTRRGSTIESYFVSPMEASA